jgi:hypothetical protein
MVSLLLGLFLTVPALWIAKGNDERQALEILENRRSIFSQTFFQMLLVKSKVESAASVAEAEIHMRSLRDSPTPSPGLAGIGVLSWVSSGERWDVHRQVISEGCPELNGFLSVPRVVEILQRFRTRQTPQLTPLFKYTGDRSNTPKVFFALLVPLQPTAAIHPGSAGIAAQILIIDVASWAQQTYLPVSLRSVKFYLSNEPDDGLRVGFNYEKKEAQRYRPADVMTIGVDPRMKLDALAAFPLLRNRLFGNQPLKDTPGGLLSYLSRVDDDSGPTADENGSRFKVARSALLSFNIAPETQIRCSAETTPEFLKNSMVYTFLRVLPLRFLGLCLVSALLVLLWMLYSDGREQIHRLAEAQQTISGLDLYRNMVQQELHDHIIQNLTLLGIQVATKGTQDAEGQKSVRNAILKQIDYLRRELRRFLVDGASRLKTIPDLVAQLQGISRHFETQSGVRCQVDDSIAGSPILSSEVLFRLCRFTEELIGNAIRHGGAQIVRIHLEADAALSTVWVTVEDDGLGFDPDNHSKGFGLQNMGAFARRSKGSLSLERRQPRGMSIRLSIPVTP